MKGKCSNELCENEAIGFGMKCVDCIKFSSRQHQSLGRITGKPKKISFGMKVSLGDNKGIWAKITKRFGGSK